jgi:hypothetical protein
MPIRLEWGKPSLHFSRNFSSPAGAGEEKLIEFVWNPIACIAEETRTVFAPLRAVVSISGLDIQPLFFHELRAFGDEIEAFLGLVAHELLDHTGGSDAGGFRKRDAE